MTRFRHQSNELPYPPTIQFVRKLQKRYTEVLTETTFTEVLLQHVQLITFVLHAFREEVKIPIPL
jgi:hypothetical protein